MNPKQYLNLALRWWWVIVAGVVIGAIGGFVYSRFQDQIYESSTKILIMQSLENQASTVLTQSEQEFGTTFLELLVTGRCSGYCRKIGLLGFDEPNQCQHSRRGAID
jgi:capsular polysaccharide biosynthesis protein